MDEQIEWARKRLTENRRDAIWGVITLAVFIWIAASFSVITIDDTITKLIPAWAYLPIFIFNVIGLCVSMLGTLFAAVCIVEALGKKVE